MDLLCDPHWAAHCCVHIPKRKSTKQIIYKEINPFGTTLVILTNTRGLCSLVKCVELSATDPLVPACRLSVEQRLSRCLDCDWFVSTAAAVSALGAVTVPPIPDRHKNRETNRIDVGAGKDSLTSHASVQHFKMYEALICLNIKIISLLYIFRVLPNTVICMHAACFCFS